MFRALLDPKCPSFEAIWGEKAQTSSAPCDAISDGSLPILPPLDINMVGVQFDLQGKRMKETSSFLYRT